MDGSGFAAQLSQWANLGTARGPRILLNRHWDGDQVTPVIVPTGNNAVMALWSTPAADEDGVGISYRLLTTR